MKEWEDRLADRASAHLGVSKESLQTLAERFQAAFGTERRWDSQRLRYYTESLSLLMALGLAAQTIEAGGVEAVLQTALPDSRWADMLRKLGE